MPSAVGIVIGLASLALPLTRPPDLAHRDRYRKRCTDDGMHRDLIVHFIGMQYLITSPFCPHMSEYIWKMLGNQGSILNARWPAHTEPDPQHLLMSKYMENMEAKARQSLDKLKNPATKGEHYDCGSNSSNSCFDYLLLRVHTFCLFCWRCSFPSPSSRASHSLFNGEPSQYCGTVTLLGSRGLRCQGVSAVAGVHPGVPHGQV